tara:strand:+ start:2112 stop:2480 length:369 start_codon:yes stop_codon:yes gene_type:complete
MASPKGYLAKDMRFNNPSYQPWEKRPLGEIVFKKLTPITLVKPTGGEKVYLKKFALRKQDSCFVVKLEGRRVYVTRADILNEEEYRVARCSENQKRNSEKKRASSKLALLKKRKGDMGTNDT